MPRLIGLPLIAPGRPGRETIPDSPIDLFPLLRAAGWIFLLTATVEAAEGVWVGFARVRGGGCRHRAPNPENGSDSSTDEYFHDYVLLPSRHVIRSSRRPMLIGKQQRSVIPIAPVV